MSTSLGNRNLYTINLPYLDPRGELIRVIIIFDEDQERIVRCHTPSKVKMPVTSDLKQQLKEHLHNCTARW